MRLEQKEDEKQSKKPDSRLDSMVIIRFYI